MNSYFIGLIMFLVLKIWNNYRFDFLTFRKSFNFLKLKKKISFQTLNLMN